MPMRIDPFAVPAHEKGSRPLAINEALKAGADYCTSSMTCAKRNILASSRGSRISQTRVRSSSVPGHRDRQAIRAISPPARARGAARFGLGLCRGP
jgi:hypothetical protein